VVVAVVTHTHLNLLIKMVNQEDLVVQALGEELVVEEDQVIPLLSVHHKEIMVALVVVMAISIQQDIKVAVVAALVELEEATVQEVVVLQVELVLLIQ
jgi:hypothetical protein